VANEEMRASWTEGGIGWVEQEAVFDATFAPITEALLVAADLAAGHRVLDVGCGSGTLLAAAVAVGAETVGVDLSPTMVEGARRRVPAATVLLADAQTTDLLEAAPGRRFDRVVSRFGVMFFDDPVRAFTRLHEAAAPGARLAFACWRSYEENPTMTLGQDLLTARLGETPAPVGPDAPGPMALADPGRTRAVLGGAGWADVVVEPLDVVLDYAYDGSDGVEHRLATVLATTTGRRARARLEPELGAAGWAALLDDVRAHIRSARVDDALRLPAATWLVTATA
jgi:SAM-dependent methyltransferase